MDEDAVAVLRGILSPEACERLNEKAEEIKRRKGEEKGKVEEKEDGFSPTQLQNEASPEEDNAENVELQIAFLDEFCLKLNEPQDPEEVEEEIRVIRAQRLRMLQQLSTG
jgi:hypothetical protein